MEKGPLRSISTHVRSELVGMRSPLKSLSRIQSHAEELKSHEEFEDAFKDAINRIEVKAKRDIGTFVRRNIWPRGFSQMVE